MSALDAFAQGVSRVAYDYQCAPSFTLQSRLCCRILPMTISYSDSRLPSPEQALELYRSVQWSSADKPKELMSALAGSHCLVTAWCDDALVGLANAISDGHLVAYFPHLLVHPSFQHRGIGSSLICMLLSRYAGFHQVVVLADARSTEFYKRTGLEPAGSTVPMWIYKGHDHE